MNYSIFYGKEGNYRDITNDCNDYNFNGRLYLPSQEHVRAQFFGDPIFGVLKHIKIINLSTMQESICASDIEMTIDDAIYIENSLRNMRKAWWNIKGKYIINPEEKLEQLHRFISIDFGSMKDEYPEQIMAIQFIKETDTVLELGSNIGRNTCTIASILNDDKRLVTLECSPDSVKQLTHNRDKNGFQFQIVNAALSKRNLIQRGWNTFVSDFVLDGYAKVNTISFSDLTNYFSFLTFNVIVADCEGALLQILRDDPNLLDTIETILIENDYHSMTDKIEMDTILFSKGFKSVYTKALPGCWSPCRDVFFQVFQKIK